MFWVFVTADACGSVVGVNLAGERSSLTKGMWRSFGSALPSQGRGHRFESGLVQNFFFSLSLSFFSYSNEHNTCKMLFITVYKFCALN